MLKSLTNYSVEGQEGQCHCVRDITTAGFLHLEYRETPEGNLCLRAVKGTTYNGSRTQIYCPSDENGLWKISDSEIDHIRHHLIGREESIPSHLREAFSCPVSFRKQ